MPAVLEFLKALVPILQTVAPTVLTLVVGTFWLNRLFVARSNFAALIERVCDSLDALMDDCAEYWSVDYIDTEAAKLGLLEAKIKGRITQISFLINLIGEKRRDMVGNLRAQLVDLADACMGGLFESKSRKKDIGRYMKIVATIYKIAVTLMRLKIWTSKLGEFIDDLCMKQITLSPEKPRREI